MHERWLERFAARNDVAKGVRGYLIGYAPDLPQPCGPAGIMISTACMIDQIGKGGDQLLPVFMTADEIAKDGKRLEDHRGKILTSKYLDKIVAFPDVRALFQRLLDDGQVFAHKSSAKQAELTH